MLILEHTLSYNKFLAEKFCVANMRVCLVLFLHRFFLQFFLTTTELFYNLTYNFDIVDCLRRDSVSISCPPLLTPLNHSTVCVFNNQSSPYYSFNQDEFLSWSFQIL